MKNKNTPLSEQDQNSTGQIVERGKIDPPKTQKYMISHFPSLILAYQYNSGGVKLVSWVLAQISMHSPF